MKRCPVCGTEYPVSQGFCPMDGNPLAEDQGGRAPEWQPPPRTGDAGSTGTALVPPVGVMPASVLRPAAEQPRAPARTVLGIRPPGPTPAGPAPVEPAQRPGPGGQVQTIPAQGPGPSGQAPSASPSAGAAGLLQVPAASAVPASPELPTGVFFPAGGLSRPKLGEPPRPTPSEDALVGRVLDQRYRIEEAIGFGGMGVVYKARHVIIDKALAIKLLRNEHASQPDVIKRFLLEAQLASRVKHPNIVDISDYGQIPGGTAYYVMEYLTGETLAHRIDSGGRLEPAQAIEIGVQILQGLHAAHSSKIIHRDLKSENIFLCRTPGAEGAQVKILDFGIARIRDKWTRLTANGALIGTPAYMSPEQAQGQEADERSDLYAFGVILFEMLAGRVPFKLPTVAMILSAQIYDTPPSMKEVEAEAPDLPNVERFIRMLLAKNRDERPQSASEAVGLLRAAAELDAGGQVPKTRRPTVTIGSWAVAEGRSDGESAIAGAAPTTAPPTTSTPEPVPGGSPEGDVPGARAVSPSGRIERRPSVIVQREAGVERIGPPIRPVTGEITPRGPMPGLSTARSGGPPTLLIIAAAASIGAAITVTLYKQYYRKPASVQATVVPPSAPPAPTFVSLSFESEPPGAQVLRDGVEPIGVTPVAHEVAPQSPARRYVFRLAGYEESATEVAPGKSNERIRVIMRPLPSPAPTPAPAAVPEPAPTSPPPNKAETPRPKPRPKPTPTTVNPEQKQPAAEPDEGDLGELKNPFPKK